MTYVLHHNGTLIKEANEKTEVVKTGIFQILADGHRLYAVDAESADAEVGLKRLRGTVRRIGEYRSFRFEWN